MPDIGDAIFLRYSVLQQHSYSTQNETDTLEAKMPARYLKLIILHQALFLCRLNKMGQFTILAALLTDRLIRNCFESYATVIISALVQSITY